LSISIFANKTPNYPKGFSPKTNTGISFTENKGQKCLMDSKNKSNKKSLSSMKGLILLVPGTGLEPVHSLKYRILSLK
jgi:hypothetical protein